MLPLKVELQDHKEKVLVFHNAPVSPKVGVTLI